MLFAVVVVRGLLPFIILFIAAPSLGVGRLFLSLILVGNGLGAIVLRQVTVSNIERIKKYIYLKNGAMYSILFLGIIMTVDAFGANIPRWISPIMTIFIVFFFFLKSRKHLFSAGFP